MRHLRRTYAYASLLAAAGLIFAGCSDTDTSTQTGPSDAPTTSAQADLSLSVSRGTLEGQPGTTFGYELTGENAGPDPASGVVVEQSFSGAVEVVDVEAGSGSCTVSDGLLRCEIGTLPVGVSRSIHVELRISSAMEAEFEGRISSSVVDPSTANNVATLRASVGVEGPDPDPKNANPDPREDDDPSGLSASMHIDPAAIIDNGTIQLGVDQEGQLNVSGGTPSSGTGTTFVGLRFLPTNAESTAPGCLCEGWGVADLGLSVSGFANNASGTGATPGSLTIESFTTTASTAVSTVVIDDGSTDIFRVTHDYHPSATPNLYEVTVTIENVSGSALSDVRYRRVMDWDIEPTAFSEFVTITGAVAASNIIFSSDDGFVSSNILSGTDQILFTGDAEDSGPADHGALFDFGFGSLAAGESITFNTYYGAAATETEALGALGTVGAEAFSLGQPNTQDGPTLGTPNTFMFGFTGVGGDPVLPGPSGPGEVCETVDFDELGGHASRLDGFELDGDMVSLGVKPGGPRSETFTALYSTDNVGGPDFDLEWAGPKAECPACEGQGNVLIIPDVNFLPHGGQGNSIDGGWIIMDGFTPDRWRIASMTVIDSDATLWDSKTAVHPNFNPYEISVDGEQIGHSEVTNREGSVQTLVFDEDDPRIDTEARVLIPEDPGAIDDLEFCRRPE